MKYSMQSVFRKGVLFMKKMFILLVVVMVAISIIPTASLAYGHDRGWRNHHQQVWRAHEREWSRCDREWIAHRGNRRWREEHIQMWPDWYRWHQEQASFLNIRISSGSGGGPTLDIDFRN
jgi:hypothetical protein